MGSHGIFSLLSLDRVRKLGLLTSAVIEAEPKEYHRAERRPLGDVQHRPERGPVRRGHGVVRGEHSDELQDVPEHEELGRP